MPSAGLIDLYGNDFLEMRESLVKVIPPREGDFNLQSFMKTLEALDLVDEIISLEIAANQGRIEMYVRSRRADNVITALLAHYPNIIFEAVEDADDPLYVEAEKENAWRQVLWPGGDEWLPFQVYDERGLLEYSSDPFIDMISGMSNEIRPGARIVSRLLLKQKGHNWSESWRSRAMKGVGGENQMMMDAMRKEERDDKSEKSNPKADASVEEQMQPIYLLIVMLGLGVMAYLSYYFIYPLWDEGKTEKFLWASIGAGVSLMVLGFGGYLLLRKLGMFRPKQPAKFYDPDLVKMRIEGAAFRMEVQIYAVMREDRSEDEAVSQLMRPSVAAYRSFDNPLGCQFAAGPIDLLDALDPTADDMGFLGGGKRKEIGEGVIGTREAAAFWHVPGVSAKVPGLVRAGSVRIPTPEPLFVINDEERKRAALVGLEAYRDGGLRMVFLPEHVMGRHHLYAAKTRMGKSTLMLHIVTNLLRMKSTRVWNGSIVVVDPHSDLVNDILDRVPADAAKYVRLIDMSDKERAFGLNLLDVHAFPNRDLTIPTIIAIARTSSVNWGDRMEAIMSWTFAALYEANKNRDPFEQYTIFDAIAFLTDEDERGRVIQESRDVDVAQWWNEIFKTLVPENDKTALAPVLRKIGEYAASPAARRVLGQRRCTLSLEDAITTGKVLLVNTARGEVGPEVSAIIGSCILNLTEFILRQQSNKESGERNPVVVVVDEMQTLPGVRFDNMLAELNKYGGSLVMATQSLDRLNEMSESGSMRETILANIGCLMVFQVNSSDATLMRNELDASAITEEDILRLPPHHCYGRANLESGAAFFSMEVLEPTPGDSRMRELIIQASAAYTTPSEDLAAEHADFMAAKIRDYFSKDDASDYGQETLR